MAESNKMKDMPVNKLMIQMGIPMILSMALQAVSGFVQLVWLNFISKTVLESLTIKQ